MIETFPRFIFKELMVFMRWFSFELYKSFKYLISHIFRLAKEK